ncbi:MAG: DUF159 family protein [Gammaproteobacteria bacterium]|nr:DUF159 family protein [Gammaproteobacteria bacterium]
MCGRFTLSNTDQVRSMFGLEIKPRFNVAPSTEILVVTDGAQFMHWAYSPKWAKSPFNLINARAESLGEKPSYTSAKRCLIIADGWFEWKKKDRLKYPYFFHMQNEIFLFAGIYNEYRNVPGCAIVTKKADGKPGQIHHRMPLIINKKNAAQWLKGEDISFAIPSQEIYFHRVSTLVNSPKNDTRECIEPYQEKRRHKLSHEVHY